MQQSFEEKFSKLTSIPRNCVTSMKNYINLVHGNEVYETVRFKGIEPGEPLELPMFEGTLNLVLDEEDNLNFNFTPSEELISIISEAFKGKVDPLNNAVVNKLKVVLDNTYKELF